MTRRRGKGDRAEGVPWRLQSSAHGSPTLPIETQTNAPSCEAKIRRASQVDRNTNAGAVRRRLHPRFEFGQTAEARTLESRTTSDPVSWPVGPAVVAASPAPGSSASDRASSDSSPASSTSWGPIAPVYQDLNSSPCHILLYVVRCSGRHRDTDRTNDLAVTWRRVNLSESRRKGGDA